MNSADPDQTGLIRTSSVFFSDKHFMSQRPHNWKQQEKRSDFLNKLKRGIIVASIIFIPIKVY